MTAEHDLVIKNGLIVDGTGADPVKGGVAIKGDRITAVGKVKGDAKRTLNAGGHAVTPGFIDVHNHADLSILYYPQAESFLLQGITSFIGGHCGDTTGPYNKFIGEPWFYIDLYEEARPTYSKTEWLIPKEAFNRRHREVYGWEVDFRSMKDYFRKVEETGLSPNMAPMAGHGDIRSYVMGTDYKRYATKREVKQMTELVDQAMQDGCIGLSVGRTYEPGRWASFEEILACAKAAAKYGGIYNSHSLRSLPRGDKKPEEATVSPLHGVLEVIDVGKQAKMSVQVSHLGNQFLVTPAEYRIMDEANAKATLQVIDDAVKEGVNVNYDVIPNPNAMGIFTSPYLLGVATGVYKVAGSPEQFSRALMMEDLVEDIKKRINAGENYSINPKMSPDWPDQKWVRVCKEKRFIGKNFREIGKLLKKEPLDAVFEVLKADPLTQVETIRRKDDWLLRAYFAHPRMMVGCDTFAVDDQYRCRSPPWMLPNQNAFGGMIYYLRRMVRETKTLTLQEAVRKITGQPAEKFKLRDRGVLREGAYADIAVWDPGKAQDLGDQIEPRRHPDGVDYVLVNGTIVVEGKKHTGEKPGRILYREKTLS